MAAIDFAIPAWSGAGVLPPIRPSVPGNSPDRSPYIVALASLVDHFAISPERMVILHGLLQFRAQLHKAGIMSGFQWLDGSFLEQVEVLEGRAPRDMDVVTFFHVPEGQTQNSLAQANGALFDARHVKVTYSMDAYFVVLGEPLNAQMVRRVSYWYGMWSHRRNGEWKGFLQVDLDPSQDEDARSILNSDGGIQHE